MKKILLIHGWSYNSYTASGNKDAWVNRLNFVEALERRFEVVRFNLPGFGGTKEPERPWKLEDFVQYVDEIIKREKPDYALGYSFGGAIFLHWKKLTGDTKVKGFLISPAIVRSNNERKLFPGWLKNFLPKKLVERLRNFYLTYIKPNPYYTKASPIMRETYRNIVGLDLREELLKVADPLTLIYGEEDSITPPKLVTDFLASHKHPHHVFTLPKGGHDIANTHTEDLVKILSEE